MANTTSPPSFTAAPPPSVLRRRNIPSFIRTKLPLCSPAMACSGDAARRLLDAAKLTVDKFVRSGMVVGLGAGRASSLAIQYLGWRLLQGDLQNVVGVPMSLSSANEAAKVGIPLNDYQENLQIDFAFDDAYMVEEEKLTAVIGRRKLEGGESILNEKSIVTRAAKLAFLVNKKQYTKDLDGSIPVLVKTSNWLGTAEEIDDLFLGDAEVWRRPSFGHADPLGGDFPLVTEEGHHLLDVIFTSPILDLDQVADNLEQIDGVVDHGIIRGIPCTVIIVAKDGVEVVHKFSKDVVADGL